MFATPQTPPGCDACGDRWWRSPRYTSLFCPIDDRWADPGCLLPGCACSAGATRPDRPSHAGDLELTATPRTAGA